MEANEKHIKDVSELILGLRPTNERRRYKVNRLSLAGGKPEICPVHVPSRQLRQYKSIKCLSSKSFQIPIKSSYV